MSNLEQNQTKLAELITAFPTFEFAYDSDPYYEGMSISARADLGYYFSIWYDYLDIWHVIVTQKSTSRQQIAKGDFLMVLESIRNLMYLGF